MNRGRFSTFLQGLDLLQAGRAEIFVLITDHVSGVAAEDTRGLILSQNDRGAVDIDLQRVALGDLKSAPQFDGEHNAAQLVNFTYNSGGFHSFLLSDALLPHATGHSFGQQDCIFFDNVYSKWERVNMI